jgi:hypothetical protein
MTQVKITYPVDALVSYHYYREDKAMAPLAQTGRLRLIGDSGAFSAMSLGTPIDLAEYAAWVHRWREHLFWAASLDVIGDPAGTLHNWRLLRDRHGLDTVPTLHAGSDVRGLDVFAKEGATLVGLGGMAGQGQAVRAFRWAVAAFRHARDHHPGMRFHLWGVTNRKFLDNLPAWSADSSGILGAAYRYAQLRVFNPATGKHHNVALRAGNRDIYKLSGLLRRVYGVDPPEIETSHPGNRTTLIQLAAASTQQYAAWLQRRHQVTPPALLAQPATHNLDVASVGPRVHVVAGTNQAAGANDLDALGGPRVQVTDTSHTATAGLNPLAAAPRETP